MDWVPSSITRSERSLAMERAIPLSPEVPSVEVAMARTSDSTAGLSEMEPAVVPDASKKSPASSPSIV